MEIQRIVFVGVIAVTTFALSLLTARIYAFGFKSGPTGVRIATLIGIAFPIIFIGANIVGRFSNNIAARVITITSDVLGGIGLYALITGCILGIILCIGASIGKEIPIYVSSIFLTVAGLLSIIGLTQARMLKVVDYTVVLPGAPTSWEGKQAILFSDTHYGLVNHVRFSKKLTDKILALNPAFVVHAGDLYDGPSVPTAFLVKDWQRLTKTIPVFFAPGNHEEYGPYNVFVASAQKAGITVLEDRMVTYDGVQIAGITYRSKSQEASAKKILEHLPIDTTIPTILINHPPTFQDSVRAQGIDLMISGHTHRGQLWPLNYIARAIYGKYIYGLHTDDTLTTITTSGVGTAGPPLRLFNTPELVRITFRTK